MWRFNRWKKKEIRLVYGGCKIYFIYTYTRSMKLKQIIAIEKAFCVATLFYLLAKKKYTAQIFFLSLHKKNSVLGWKKLFDRWKKIIEIDRAVELLNLGIKTHCHRISQVFCWYLSAESCKINIFGRTKILTAEIRIFGEPQNLLLKEIFDFDSICVLVVLKASSWKFQEFKALKIHEWQMF